jgi:hypothetical protein
VVDLFSEIPDGGGVRDCAVLGAVATLDVDIPVAVPDLAALDVLAPQYALGEEREQRIQRRLISPGGV